MYFQETGDEGEIWFGEESVKKMVTWAYKHVPPTYAPEASGSGTSEEESGKGPSVLECGCGQSLYKTILAHVLCAAIVEAEPLGRHRQRHPPPLPPLPLPLLQTLLPLPHPPLRPLPLRGNRLFGSERGAGGQGGEGQEEEVGEGV